MSQPLSVAQQAAELLAAQAKNYGEYVAIVPIDINGARAYNPGHAVSSASVNDGTVDKSLVAKVGTKAAEAVAPSAAPVVDTPKV